MIGELLRNESGYSLTELMVAIFILTAAIIPMASMFDVGLRAASMSSNYDRARALANEQMERAKSLPYAEARDKFPGTTTTSYDGSGKVEVGDQKDPEYDDFRYDVVKQYVEPIAPADGTTTTNLEPTDTDEKMVRITVTVRWGDNDYTTTGVVAE